MCEKGLEECTTESLKHNEDSKIIENIQELKEQISVHEWLVESRQAHRNSKY